MQIQIIQVPRNQKHDMKITFSTYASLNAGLIFDKETNTYLLTYSKFDCGLEDKVSRLKKVFSN